MTNFHVADSLRGGFKTATKHAGHLLHIPMRRRRSHAHVDTFRRMQRIQEEKKQRVSLFAGKHWQRHFAMFFSGSILWEVLPMLMFFLTWTTAIALIDWALEGGIGTFSTMPHSVGGLGLGLLLVFRNNIASDRFYEGRNIWGRLTLSIADACRLLGAYYTDAVAEKVMRLFVAYAYFLKMDLRKATVRLEVARPKSLAALLGVKKKHAFWLKKKERESNKDDDKPATPKPRERSGDRTLRKRRGPARTFATISSAATSSHMRRGLSLDALSSRTTPAAEDTVSDSEDQVEQVYFDPERGLQRVMVPVGYAGPLPPPGHRATDTDSDGEEGGGHAIDLEQGTRSPPPAAARPNRPATPPEDKSMALRDQEMEDEEDEEMNEIVEENEGDQERIDIDLVDRMTLSDLLPNGELKELEARAHEVGLKKWEDDEYFKTLRRPNRRRAPPKVAPYFRAIHTLHVAARVLARERDVVPEAVEKSIIKDMKDMQGAMMASFKIINTPLPYSYDVHLHTFLGVYFLTISIPMVSALGWGAVPASFFLTFVFWGIEYIAAEIENPFGYDFNDLDLDSICDTIRGQLYILRNPPTEEEMELPDMFF